MPSLFHPHTDFPLGLNALQWAARTVLIAELKKYRGHKRKTAYALGLHEKQLARELVKLKVEEGEY